MGAVGATVVLTRQSATPVTPSCTVGATPNAAGTAGYAFSPEQAQNASIIAAVALRDGLPDHAVTVALAAAMQETKLRNLTYGDLDSVGLFQQRASQGWGSRTQLLDPTYATSAFYNHLTKVAGWESMAVTVAAQTVQRSAAPDAYAAWESDARAWAQALTGETPRSLSCRFSSFGGAVPPSSALTDASVSELGSSLIGKPVSTKVGWQVAEWAVAHAYAYHLSTVSFDGWTWNSESGKWTHPGTVAGAIADVTVG